MFYLTYRQKEPVFQRLRLVIISLHYPRKFDFCREREREYFIHNMVEVTPDVQSIDLAQSSMVIGGKTFVFVSKPYISRLAEQGFGQTGMEWDIRNPDSIIEHGRMHGIQPGRGIVAEPDKIKPEIKEEMDLKYGSDNWRFVEIRDDEGHEFAKPLIKPRKR